MEVFPQKLMELFNKLEVRSAVLVSLALQIVLILFASFRRRSKNLLLSFNLWLAYLSADSVAIFALSHVLDADNERVNNELIGFWSPFLILHLGGPHTITAYSMEDNELWARHLLNLAFQVILAIYSSIRCFTTARLLAPTCLVLLAGVIKYGERIWALRHASKENFEETHRKKLEAKDYLRQDDRPFMQRDAEEEKDDDDDDNDVEGDISEEKVLLVAYRLFVIFQRLIVDLQILYKREWRFSWAFCLERSSEKVFEVIIVELNFFYDVLYTKAVMFYSQWGYILSLGNFISILLALLLFRFATNKDGYDPADIVISYILLGGAIIIEVYEFSKLILSDLTMVWLMKLEYNRILPVFKRLFFFFHPPKRARWSNSMGQFNLIRVCDAKKSRRHSSELTLWDKYCYTKFISVQPALRKFIWKELRNQAMSCRQFDDLKRLYNERVAETVLKEADRMRRLEVDVDLLTRSLGGDFHRSILVWHISTDMCADAPDNSNLSHDVRVLVKLSKCISEYMLYLMVNLPGMLGAGFGHILLTSACMDFDEVLGFERSTEAFLGGPQCLRTIDAICRRRSSCSRY